LSDQAAAIFVEAGSVSPGGCPKLRYFPSVSKAKAIKAEAEPVDRNRRDNIP